MRFSSPIVWIVGVVFFVLLMVVIGVVRAVGAAKQAVRARGWSDEKKERERWTKLDARVVSARRVTDGGVFILVIELPEGAHASNPYAAPTPRVLKRTDHVGEKVGELVESAASLPVLLDPASGAVVLDIPTLVARAGASLDADALAAEDYAQRGRWKWQPAPAA